MKKIALFVAYIFVFFSCKEDEPTTSGFQDFSVIATVKNQETNEPVSGVRVTVWTSDNCVNSDVVLATNRGTEVSNVEGQCLFILNTCSTPWVSGYKVVDSFGNILSEEEPDAGKVLSWPSPSGIILAIQL
ncbi:hypothetical protein [Ekhidna sp.]|uniref:hypothetical protein n=1 Tax=Ekhidna sp. TaxID=2608089 RepID=UPI00351878A3